MSTCSTFVKESDFLYCNSRNFQWLIVSSIFFSMHLIFVAFKVDGSYVCSYCKAPVTLPLKVQVAVNATTINILTTMDPSFMVYCCKAENLNMNVCFWIIKLFN